MRSGKHKDGVTVCGRNNCLVLLPDDWMWDGNTVGTDWQDGGYPETSTDKVTWQTMEAAGAVCLPAAGYREGAPDYEYPAYVSSVDYLNFYWSASQSDEYYVDDLGNFDPQYIGARHWAQSVRLVAEVQ